MTAPLWQNIRGSCCLELWTGRKRALKCLIGSWWLNLNLCIPSLHLVLTKFREPPSVQDKRFLLSMTFPSFYLLVLLLNVEALLVFWLSGQNMAALNQSFQVFRRSKGVVVWDSGCELNLIYQVQFSIFWAFPFSVSPKLLYSYASFLKENLLCCTSARDLFKDALLSALEWNSEREEKKHNPAGFEPMTSWSRGVNFCHNCCHLNKFIHHYTTSGNCLPLIF